MFIIKKYVVKLLTLFNININEKIKILIDQIFKFLIVGFIATVIDFGFLFIFKEVFNISIIIANTISFTISVVYNYIASVKWVFKVNKEKSKTRNFILFVLLSIIGLLLNDFIVWIVVYSFSIYYLLAKIIATIIVMIFNFITRKLFLE